MGDHRLIFELDRESFCLKSISQSCPARSASCTGTTCILYRYRYTAAWRAMMAEQWAMGADDRHFQRAQRAPATRVQCCRDQTRSAARATTPALSHSRSSGRRSVSLLRLLRLPEEPDRPPVSAPAVRQRRHCGASRCSECIPTTLWARRWRALPPLKMPAIRLPSPIAQPSWRARARAATSHLTGSPAVDLF